MRDAFGGVANLVIIVVFLVLVSGYLAFNVNYTKAFRVKNKIISTIEEYEGKCVPGNEANDCHIKIRDYMRSLGYDSPDPDLSGDGYDCGGGYCIKLVEVAPPSSTSTDDTKKRAYFKVVTQISIDIPIINKILPGLKLFQVSGDTKPIVVVGA